MSNDWIATLVIAGVLLLLAYWFFFRKSEASGVSRAGNFVLYATLAVLIGFGIYFIYEGVTGDRTQSNNLAVTPVDATSTTIVPADQTPPQSGPQGGNYGLQWWMYIEDWDYKFGEEKPVVRRGGNGIFNPYVYLSPTENTLCVKVSVFPNNGSAVGTSEPAAVGSDGSATDDSFTCKVPNVPLQKWFCVGLSLSGRNVDIYLDGLLVRSCLLPGVPRTPSGSVEIMPSGGFSGSVIDMFSYSRALVPADAAKFLSKGTSGTSYNALPSKTLFGYSVKFGVLDDAGKQIKSFTF
jgi:hypothetical protein